MRQASRSLRSPPGQRAAPQSPLLALRWGDHVIFNMQDALPADLAVTMFRVSGTNMVQVRFRNLHASNAYTGDTLACTALVIRTQ